MVNDESRGLCLPQPDGKWLIRCDGSDFGLGGALDQLPPDATYLPVAFYSKKTWRGTSRNHQGRLYSKQTYWSIRLDTPRERNVRHRILFLQISELDRWPRDHGANGA